jgi:hypothetical protein
MANVVFTSNNNTISMDFNAVATLAQCKKSKWRYDAIVCVMLAPSDACVIVRNINAKDYPFSFNGVNGLPVDNVDGTVPTSNEHLYNLISSIIN